MAIICPEYNYSTSVLILQSIKSYLRRGTAREMLGYYKEAIEGQLLSEYPFYPANFLTPCFKDFFIFIFVWSVIYSFLDV